MKNPTVKYLEYITITAALYIKDGICNTQHFYQHVT